LTEWLKGLAPSNELRKWFGHDPAKWDSFLEKYRQELTLTDNADLSTLASYVDKHERITLVFAAKDTDHNNAVALKQFIEARQLPV